MCQPTYEIIINANALERAVWRTMHQRARTIMLVSMSVPSGSTGTRPKLRTCSSSARMRLNMRTTMSSIFLVMYWASSTATSHALMAERPPKATFSLHTSRRRLTSHTGARAAAKRVSHAHAKRERGNVFESRSPRGVTAVAAHVAPAPD